MMICLLSWMIFLIKLRKLKLLTTSTVLHFVNQENKEYIGDYSIPREEKYEEKQPEPQPIKKEEKFLSGVKKGFFDSKPS